MPITEAPHPGQCALEWVVLVWAGGPGGNSVEWFVIASRFAGSKVRCAMDMKPFSRMCLFSTEG